MPPVHWPNANRSVKWLATAFYLTMAIGYGIALANAQIKMGNTTEGLVRHIRGSPDGFAYPKEPAELIEVAHAHGFSVPIMYLVLGGLFLCTTIREPWKRWWAVLPFLGIVIDHVAPWLIRYQAPQWAWLMLAGHALSGLAFVVLIAVPLWEMWGPARALQGGS